VFRSDQKHIIEHCQASFSQNNLQVIQKQDLTRSYSYISAENSLNDADQEKNNTHVKHTAETTDFHDDWDNVHHSNLNCLWIDARSWQSKNRFFESVVNHVKRVVTAQVIAVKSKLFLLSKINAAILSDIIKNEWDKFLNAEERDDIIDWNRFDNFLTADETKMMNSKLLYL